MILHGQKGAMLGQNMPAKGQASHTANGAEGACQHSVLCLDP